MPMLVSNLITPDHVIQQTKEYERLYNIQCKSWELESFEDVRLNCKLPKYKPPGCYCFYNAQKSLLRVGAAKGLGGRLIKHFVYVYERQRRTERWREDTKYIQCITVQEEWEPYSLEMYLIMRLHPPFNTMNRPKINVMPNPAYEANR
jgi:hypothetical protein